MYYGINKYLKVIEDNTSYTTVKHLSGKKIKDIDFPIPPLKEQQRIVNILDDAFANINLSLTKLQQKIPSLLELFQSHLNRLFDSKDEHWNEHTLEEISEALITKGATPTTYGFPFVDEGITFLRSECVSDHGFEPNGIRYISEEANVHMKRSIVKGGDVLISITGYLGRVVRYPTHMDDGNINQHIARVRINNETINPDFIVYQLQSERIQNHYRDVYTGTAQPLLSLKQIRETVVFIPPITVQHEIIDSLNNFYVQTREIEGKYQTRLDSFGRIEAVNVARSIQWQINRRNHCMSSGMNEAETRLTYIDPELRSKTWGPEFKNQTKIRPEFSVTPGRIEGHGRRGKPLSADYVLEHRNRKLAVIEAKRWDLSVSEGAGQAKDYARMLDIRFTYSSNGQGFYEIDMLSGEERHLRIDQFPTPEELWERTFDTEDEFRDELATVPFEDRGGTWQPRYYQDNAIERTLQAISDGKDRILLTLATGTGKTSIAFQVTWKLFETRWNRKGDGRRPRVLFLADRNILANQAFNSFSAFQEDALCRIRPDEIRKKGRVPMNASIFFTIFQTFMSGDDGERGVLLREVLPRLLRPGDNRRVPQGWCQ